jgi:hypothetical protein
MQRAAKIFWVSLLACCFILSAGPVSADSQIPPEGGVWPQVILPVPQNADHQNYLGITGKETFAVPEIKAEVVIIEIFNMY